MTSNVLFTVGTAKVWKSSGGDGVLTFTSVATAAGRQGDRVDLGAILAAGPAARAAWFRWYVTTKCQATGLAIGNTLDLYFGGWNDDATPAQPDAGGFLGASDAAYSTAAGLNNLKLAGSVIVDSTSGSTVLSKSGLVFLPYRYVAPVLWNGSGATASATATDTQVWLTPINPQAQ
jgi:hypothetical protein